MHGFCGRKSMFLSKLIISLQVLYTVLLFNNGKYSFEESEKNLKTLRPPKLRLPHLL